MSGDSMRLFVAANPPAEVRSQLAEIQRRLETSLGRAEISWSKPEQIHVTLKFLGDFPSPGLGELKSELAQVCAGASRLELQARGLGVFPDACKPRVIWVGLNGQMEALLR